MIGLHVKYQAISTSHTLKVSNFCFDGESWKKGHEKDAGEGKVYVLKCKCGGNDWSDNGRSINEFECQCCGQFLKVH